MTTLPDLPQAAIDAAWRKVPCRCGMVAGKQPYHDYDCQAAAVDRDSLRDMLAAAAPHLVAAERGRIALALLGCLDCGRIHTPHPATFRHKGEPLEHQSWAAPDGHAYRPPHLTRQQIAAAISPPQETRND